MVQSVKRALSLLQILSNSSKKCSLAELSAQADIPPSTVHRLLQTLKEVNFVTQDVSTSQYYLGSALISLGIEATNYLDIRKIAHSILIELANDTEEDAYLSMADGNYGVLIESVSGPHPLKVIGSALARVPLHCGAARKILLAYKSDIFISNYIDRKLEQYTENSITDPRKLLLQLEEIRMNGYALSIGEHLKDATGISAPVFDSLGNSIAAIGIMGPSIRITENKYSHIIHLVKKHAQELSMALGYSQ